MPRHAIFITPLHRAPYIGRMAVKTRMGDDRQPPSARFLSRPYECGRMSRWRRRLFAAMARLGDGEASYLQIPNAKTILQDATVGIFPEGNFSTLANVSHVDGGDRLANISDRDASRTDRINIRILDLLARMDVTLDLDVTARRQALEAMAMRMATMNGLNSELIFRALWRREQAASTAIGCGIVLPHARVGGIDQPILLFARTRQPIIFGAPDGRPVSILLAIVVPEHANDDHLQILASTAERFSNDALRARLRGATSPSTVKQLFA
jgi:PTS system nitrogen regulatory IIA component